MALGAPSLLPATPSSEPWALLYPTLAPAAAGLRPGRLNEQNLHSKHQASRCMTRGPEPCSEPGDAGLPNSSGAGAPCQPGVGPLRDRDGLRASGQRPGQGTGTPQKQVRAPEGLWDGFLHLGSITECSPF